MVRKSCIGLVVAFVLIAVAPAAAVGDFTSGQWKGAAYFKDGKFFRCAIHAPYINRWDLLFSIDEAGYFSVLLRNEKLELLGDMIFGNKIGIRLQIDDTPVIIRPFTAISTNLLETKFATNLDWVQRLPTGKILRINAGSRVWRFPLTDLKEALPLLRACAAKHRGA